MFKRYVRSALRPKATGSVRSSLLLQQRFNPSTDIAGQTPLKSSVQRAIRAAVLSQWKIEPETLESVWGKKESLVHIKWSGPIAGAAVHVTDSDAGNAQPGTHIIVRSAG
jgi:hypothetical protein